MQVSQERDSKQEGAFFSGFSPRCEGLGETRGRFLGMENGEPRRAAGFREPSGSWLRSAMYSKRRPLALPKRADLKLAGSEA